MRKTAAGPGSPKKTVGKEGPARDETVFESVKEEKTYKIYLYTIY